MVALISFKQKSQFFDRDKIQRKVDAGKRRILNRAGATTRKIARRSMKKAPKKAKTRFETIGTYKSGKRRGQVKIQRGRVSNPGRPPYRRSDPGLHTILYVHEPRTDSVTIGPVLLSRSNRRRPIPSIHEHGGSVTISRRQRSKNGRRSFSVNERFNRRTRTLRYPQRPFMRPAGEHVARKLMPTWAKGSMQ